MSGTDPDVLKEIGHISDALRRLDCGNNPVIFLTRLDWWALQSRIPTEFLWSTAPDEFKLDGVVFRCRPSYDRDVVAEIGQLVSHS